MPYESGLELIETYQDRDFYVVFATSFNEYAIKALRQRAFDFLTKYAVKFNKPRFNQQNIDTLKLEKYFFSDEFHNGLLSTHDIRKNYYMHRLNETRNHLDRVQKIFDPLR